MRREPLTSVSFQTWASVARWQPSRLASLGISDPYQMTSREKAEVQRLHFLVTAFNAMQPECLPCPGGISSGALSVLPDQLGFLLDDGDGRWINRGAFD